VRRRFWSVRSPTTRKWACPLSQHSDTFPLGACPPPHTHLVPMQVIVKHVSYLSHQEVRRISYLNCRSHTLCQTRCDDGHEWWVYSREQVCNEPRVALKFLRLQRNSTIITELTIPNYATFIAHPLSSLTSTPIGLSPSCPLTQRRAHFSASPCVLRARPAPSCSSDHSIHRYAGQSASSGLRSPPCPLTHKVSYPYKTDGQTDLGMTAPRTSMAPAGRHSSGSFTCRAALCPQAVLQLDVFIHTNEKHLLRDFTLGIPL
jgi:hypothetical protein